MIFKKITNIPEVDSYFYYRMQRKIFLENFFFDFNKIREILTEKEDLFIFFQKNFFINNLINNIIDYSFSKKKITGKYLCLEKKGIRIKTNSEIINILHFKDFCNIISFNYREIIKKRFLDEFENLKIFKYLKLEYSILSSNKQNYLKSKQNLRELNKLNFILNIQPERWIPNKGMWSKLVNGFLFNPYSKTPQNLKNKNFQKIFYPSKIKEFYFEPLPKKSFRYFIILDIKKKIWIIQTKIFKRNFKFLGSIYVYKFPFAFIVGINGIPVLLHRNQLFLSCREMKKSKNLLKFTEFFFLRIFAKYKLEKRINVIIQDRILLSKNFEFKVKLLNKTLNDYNQYIFKRKNFKNFVLSNTLK